MRPGAALAYPGHWRQERLGAKGSAACPAAAPGGRPRNCRPWRSCVLVPLSRIRLPSTFSSGNKKALRIFSFRKYSQCSVPFSRFHSAVPLEEVLNVYGSLKKNTAKQVTPLSLLLSGPSVPQDVICPLALYTPLSHLAQFEYGYFFQLALGLSDLPFVCIP